MEDEYSFPLDPSVVGAHADAVKALEEARNTYDDDLISACEAELERLDEELYETTMVVRMRGLGRKRAEDLTKAHPPTIEQVKRYQESMKALGLPMRNNPLNYNSETFPPVLIHACLVSPELTLEEVQAIWDSEIWGRGELGALFSMALGLSNMMMG